VLKTNKVTLLFNIYVKHVCNSFTFVYSLYINNETNQGKIKMNNSNFKMASDEAIKFLANKNNMTSNQVSMLIIEGGKAKEDYMKMMEVAMKIINA